MSEYLRLFQRIIDVCNLYSEKLPQLSTYTDRLITAIKLLEKAYTKVQTNSLTGKLLALDTARDDAYLHMRYSVQAALYAPDTGMRESAKELEIFMRSLDWSLQNESYSKESALIKGLLDGFENNKKVSKAIDNLGFRRKAQYLGLCQQNFEGIQATRNAEEAQKPEATARVAYPQIRTAWTKFTRFVEVMYDMEQNPDYVQMSKEINEIIDDIMTRAKSRTTRHEHKEKLVDENLQN